MPVTPERLERLIELGLTEYEARAYLALLELGDAQAKDVVRVGHVPKGKVYAALTALHERGLAEIVPERPKRYLPLPVERYVRARMSELGRRLSGLAAEEERLARMFKPAERPKTPPPDVGSVRSVRGRRNVTERIDGLLAEAEREVTLLLAQAGAARLAPHEAALRDLAAAGVRIRVLHAPGEAPPGRWAHDTDATPLADAAPVDAIVVDHEVALLVHRDPLSGHHYRGRDAAVELRDPAMAGSLLALLDAAKPVPPRATPASAPRGVVADLRAAPHAPGRLTRALTELGLGVLDPEGDRAQELRAAARAEAATLDAQLPGAPEARASAISRLFRDAGLGEVTFRGGDVHLEAPSASPAWRALGEGLLEGLFPEGAGAPGETPQEAQG